MGPALYAYRPWVNADGTPAGDGATLPVVTLLRYESSEATDSFEHALAGYQHPDEWEGAVWVTTEAGGSAVVFAGTKSTGARYWYGYVNPQGPDKPCAAWQMEHRARNLIWWNAPGTVTTAAGGRHAGMRS